MNVQERLDLIHDIVCCVKEGGDSAQAICCHLMDNPELTKEITSVELLNAVKDALGSTSDDDGIHFGLIPIRINRLF